MIKLFKRNQPNIILFIIFIGILLWVPLFIFKPEQHQVDFQFSGVINNLYQFLGERYYFRNVLSILLIIAISLLLSRLNTNFLFINFRTQMPGYWFVLLTAPLIYLYDLSQLLIATLFIVFALYKLFESYDKKSMSFELIDAGFLISLGSIFYPPVLCLHLFLFGALLVLQGYSWKEWTLVVLGGLIPFAVMWGISYTFDSAFQTAFSDIFVRSKYRINLNLGNRIFIFSTVALIFLASIQMVGVFGLKKINSRRFFGTFLALSIVVTTVFFIISRVSFLVVLLSISLTYLFTHYFYLLKRSRLGNILFYLILIATIISIVNTLFPVILKA